MLKEIRVEDWKSFRDSTLYLDPLTILIGTNASGKSNILDALLFLMRAASGTPLTAILKGDSNISGLRGGLEWACRTPHDKFAIEAKIAGANENTEFQYRIQIKIGNEPEIFSESLKRVKYRPRAKTVSSEIHLFRTDPCEPSNPAITARLYNKKQGKPRPSSRSSSILSQLHPEAFSKTLQQDISEGVESVIKALKGIFILDPIPSHMRDYSQLSRDLESDASNIAGVIAGLEDKNRQQIENTLTGYASKLPEKDIVRIYAEKVGRFNADAMLYCDEKWGDEETSVDARGMSDGTLRFLSILVALLTRPEGTLLVVEEVDNGLHPSRAHLLIDVLQTIGAKRKIDILVTTHNPALLDKLGPEMTPFIIISHRDPKDGSSCLTLLEDIKQLPKLLAAGPIGTLSSQGKIEAAVKQQSLPF